MGRIVRLPERRLRIEAPAELTFQVVSSAGTILERRSDDERVVEFHAQVRGRPVVTTELVRLDPPRRIDYEWLTGPLQNVRETISVSPAEGAGCALGYEGSFETPHGGLVGLVESFVVRRAFDRAVREHLREAKHLAEARASRSKVFRRPPAPRSS